MQPLLWVCKGLVVVLKRGCSLIGRSKSIICDLDKNLQWYFVKGGGLG